MKSIKIKELRLENFKCHRALTLSPQGDNMDILGDNATGKSTTYDAFTWLLFGTDSQGNGEKSIEVKPLDANGEVADHQAVTAVEAILLVDGEEVSLRRTMQEIWTTKRGEAVPVYSGNASEYYVDGVPVKQNAFKAQIEEIISADLFKLLTNVHYFAQDLHWQKRRERLFEMAGTMTDAEIMATDARFDYLATALGKLNIEQLKAKLTADRKGLVGARNEIPARINECQKSLELLEGLDFAAAKAEIERLNVALDAKQTELAKVENNTAVTSKQVELREAQLEMEKLESENRAFRASQAPANPDERNFVAGQIVSAEGRADRASQRRATLVKQNEELEVKIDACRKEWAEVNGQTFSASSCPTCGQKLPADQLAQAKERFEQDKQKRLTEVVANADRYKALKQSTSEAFQSAVAEEEQARAEADTLRKQLAEIDSNVVVVVDMADYAERKAGIQGWVGQVQAELMGLSQDSQAAGNAIRTEIASIRGQIKEQTDIVGKQSVLAYTQERVEELRKDASNTAERLAEVEKQLYLIDEYGRYKAQFVEKSVNSLFRLCEWRLFREQANGGIEDRCDATFNGVPYLDLNSGCKINVGIDIINALSRHYGVSVPLIVDNAESVTQLENTDTQVIRLVVSESDKALRITYK